MCDTCHILHQDAVAERAIPALNIAMLTYRIVPLRKRLQGKQRVMQ